VPLAAQSTSSKPWATRECCDIASLFVGLSGKTAQDGDAAPEFVAIVSPSELVLALVENR